MLWMQLMSQGQSHPKTVLIQGHPSPLAQGQPLLLSLEKGMQAFFCRPGCSLRLHQGFRPQMSSQEDEGRRAIGRGWPKGRQVSGPHGRRVGMPGRPPALGSHSWSTQKETCSSYWGSS